MTLTVILPDTIARRLVLLPQSERDSLIAELLADVWDTEDDLRLDDEAAIRRGVADDEAGQFMSLETLIARMDEHKARAR